MGHGVIQPWAEPADLHPLANHRQCCELADQAAECPAAEESIANLWVRAAGGLRCRRGVTRMAWSGEARLQRDTFPNHRALGCTRRLALAPGWFAHPPSTSVPTQSSYHLPEPEWPQRSLPRPCRLRYLRTASTAACGAVLPHIITDFTVGL